MFDLDMFKQSTATGEVSTKVIPCEPGEYPAIISRHEVDVTNPKDGKAPQPFLNLFWKIDDVGQVQHTGRDPLTVRQTIWLDATADGRGLDMAPGKNIGLGRLRVALGQDDPTRPWSFDMLDSGVAKVKVVNEPDKKDPDTVYDRITAVTKL
jgi:hypothetical protein